MNAHERMAKNAYTPYPLSQLRSSDIANSDVAPAGPIARTMEAASCAMPLVAPTELLFGAAPVTKMKMHPGGLCQISRSTLQGGL